MISVDTLDVTELQAALETASDPKAVKRLMVALAYADGVAVDTLGDRYGIPRSTIYAWLARFEERPLDEAIRDDSRPGRPPGLDDAARARLAASLADPPTDHGFEAERWTPTLVRRHVAGEFDVEYSVGHAGRLLRELGDR